MRGSLSPAQVANQIPFRLKGDLKNAQTPISARRSCSRGFATRSSAGAAIPDDGGGEQRNVFCLLGERDGTVEVPVASRQVGDPQETEGHLEPRRSPLPSPTHENASSNSASRASGRSLAENLRQ